MKHLLLSAALCGALAAPLGAQGVVQQIRQLQQMLEDFGIQSDQLDALLAQLKLFEDQLSQLQSTHAALTGPREIVGLVMGRDFDRLLERKVSDLPGLIRGIQAGDWSALLGDAANPMRSQMETALAAAGFDAQTLRAIASSGHPGATGIAQRASTGAVLSAAAQNSYEEAGQSLARVEALVGLIPEMADLKASMDHNTRVTAELAIAMTRIWELEATQTIGAGNAGLIDAATLAEERRYMDFTLPELP